MNNIVFWGTLIKNFGLALLFSVIVGLIFQVNFLTGFVFLFIFTTIILVISEFSLELVKNE